MRRTMIPKVGAMQRSERLLVHDTKVIISSLLKGRDITQQFTQRLAGLF